MIFKLLLLFVGALVAFGISAICGGGASLILIPILNLLLPISLVPFSLTVGTFASSASRLVVFKKHINRKIFFWFVPFALPAVLLGAWLIKYANPVYLQFAVALVLIANLPQFFQSEKKQKRSEKPFSKFVLALLGFIAGLVSGITGAIGLLFNRFYLQYGLTKEEIIATRAANEIVLHLIKLIVYVLLGLYSANAWYFGLGIAAASIVSAYLVKYVLPFISEFIFRKIGYGTMVFAGIILLISTSQQIIEQDKIQLSTEHVGNKNETTVKWRNSDFILEYALDDGLEIERPIKHEELPPRLKQKYNELLTQYDKIFLEKVFKFGEEISYEFYCYKNNELTKLEFDEDEL